MSWQQTILCLRITGQIVFGFLGANPLNFATTMGQPVSCTKFIYRSKSKYLVPPFFWKINNVSKYIILKEKETYVCICRRGLTTHLPLPPRNANIELKILGLLKLIILLPWLVEHLKSYKFGNNLFLWEPSIQTMCKSLEVQIKRFPHF